MLADFSCRTVVPYELFWPSILATTLVLFRGTLARTRQDTGGVSLAQKATAVKYVKWGLMVPPEEWAAAKRRQSGQLWPDSEWSLRRSAASHLRSTVY